MNSSLPWRRRRVQRWAKRLIDVLVSLFAMLLLFPVSALIAVAVKWDSSGSIFFRQRRCGLLGQLFWIYKFRSMVEGADYSGGVTGLRDPRVTRVGRFLRLSSLDELPQLVNVLRGEMSLVGPRALPPGSIRASEAKRLEMKPGVTGLAVVRGRQSLGWEQRAALDLFYVEHWDLMMDIRILLATLPVVFSRRNVYDADNEMKPRILQDSLTVQTPKDRDSTV